MSSVKMTCRVCGKEYEPCRSIRKNPNVFHWQEVACSPECGSVYLQRINESRGVAAPTKKNKHKRVSTPAVTEVKAEETAELIDETVYMADSVIDVNPVYVEKE